MTSLNEILRRRNPEYVYIQINIWSSPGSTLTKYIEELTL
jgi:hypothetical protein